MLIDNVTLNISAGKGGDGVVRWRREKGIPYGGPAGGDGGKGGDVYVRAVRDIYALKAFKHKKDWAAPNGDMGQKRSMYGRSAEDLYLDFPVGTILTNVDYDIVYNLDNDGEVIRILKGGRGGLGNENFKTSTNRTPEEFTRGGLGESAVFKVELKLIADIGIIGKPNSGKSSLLNSITAAGAKVGDYPFTTLEPNLGAYHGLILADIPGLIEGASEGKGLGHKFLKHITRTKVLLHLVASNDEDPIESYKLIRKELEKFDSNLLNKKEIVILSKVDTIDEKTLTSLIKKFKKELKLNVLTLSLYDEESIKSLGDYLTLNTSN